MREGFFVAFVLILALVLIAVSYWFFLQRAARFMGVSLTQAFDNLFRPDLDTAKLTHEYVNFIYRRLMGKTAKKGPNKEFLPIAQIEVRMPEEDFHFVQQNVGVPEFTRQLSDHRHDLALKKGWLETSADPVPILITMDSQLRRLRPAPVLAPAGRVLSHTRPISDFGPEEVGTVPIDVHRAAVQYGARTWEMTSAKSPYTFGRSRDNHIHTNFEQISSRHGEFRFEKGYWVLTPLKTVNPTQLNGVVVTERARLHHGDVITVGDSGPIRFDIVFNSAARDKDTDSLSS